MTACCQFRKYENNFGALMRKILTFVLVVLSTVNLEAMAMSNEKKAEEQVGIILLHGAGLGSWIWEKVIPELKSKSIAIDLPGRAGKAATFRNLRLRDFADSVVQDIEKSKFQKVILVAHSVSGALALQVSSMIPGKIASIVFIGAGIPNSGEAYLDGMPFLSRLMVRIFSWLNPDGLKAPSSAVRKALCNDLEPADSERVISHMVPEAPALFTGTTEWVQPKRSVYVLLTEDKSDLTPSVQEKMRSHLRDAKPISLPSGHLPMLSQPHKLAALLNEEAEAASGKGTPAPEK
jgi:pimeloyl-ACP methyl ester carboxylesterase